MVAALVDDFVRHRGWRIRAESPARNDLGAVLAAIAALQPHPAGGARHVPDVGTGDGVNALLDPYADAIEPLARTEIANAPAGLTRDELVERVVAGTILLERAMAALRRMAQEHYAVGEPNPHPRPPGPA